MRLWIGVAALAAAMLVTRVVTAQTGDADSTLRAYQTANGLLERGLYDLAIPEYQSFLKAHPEHPQASVARYGLGVCLYRLNRLEESLAVLDEIEAGRAFPFAAEVLLIRGHANLRLGQPDDAVEPLQRLLRRHDDHGTAPEAAALLVESLHRSGQHDAVLELAGAAIEEWPRAGQRDRIELYAGLSEVAEGRHDRASAWFESIVERDRTSAVLDRAQLLLAQSLQRAGKDQRALKAFAAVIGSGDEALRPDASLGLAQLLRRAGRLDEAAAALETLLREHPTHATAAPAQFELGLVRLDEGRFDEAAERLAAVQSAAVESLRDDAAYWRAKAELRGGHPEAARRTLERALERHGKSPLRAPMRYDLGVALSRAGETDAAMEMFRRFRRDHSSHELVPSALHAEMSLALESGAYDDARTLAAAFAEDHAQHRLMPAVALVAGEAAYFGGDDEAAIEIFTAFVEDRPDDERASRARYRLGMSLSRVGRGDEAAPLLLTVLNASPDDATRRSAEQALGDIAFASGAWADAERWFSRRADDDQETDEVAQDAGLKLGIALARQDRHEPALERFEALLDDHPTGRHAAHAAFERGQSLMALGRDADAAAAFQALLDGEHADRFAPFARRHLGSIALRQGKPVDAETWFAAAIASGDDELVREARYDRARALLATGKARKALEELDRLLESPLDVPQKARAHASRVLALGQLERHEDVLAAVRALGSDAPLERETIRAVRYERAVALAGLERVDDAIAELTAIVDESADDRYRDYALLELASLEMNRDRYDVSVPYLDRLLERRTDPADTLAVQGRYRRAVCAHHLGARGEVIDLLESFAEAHPESDLAASADLLCGDALVEEGRPADAVPYLERAADGTSPDALREPALLKLGDALAELQEWSRSREAFATHLEEFPRSDHWYQARFGAGWALENEGRLDEAIAAYREVTDGHRGETAARAQFQIGECHFAREEHEDAIRELLRVDILYRHPRWSAAALYEAGRCFEAIGKIGEARAQYREVLERFADSTWSEPAAQRLESLAAPALPGRGSR